jgi:DeoR/GlpR family transcriptional regulator of sugar metabolism
MMRADVVNAVLEKGCEAIVLSDSSKFSVVHPYPLGPVARFSRVITDSGLPMTPSAADGKRTHRRYC